MESAAHGTRVPLSFSPSPYTPGTMSGYSILTIDHYFTLIFTHSLYPHLILSSRRSMAIQVVWALETLGHRDLAVLRLVCRRVAEEPFSVSVGGRREGGVLMEGRRC